MPENVVRASELVDFAEFVYEEMAGSEVVAVREAVEYSVGGSLSRSRMVDDDELASIYAFTFFLRAREGLLEFEHGIPGQSLFGSASCIPRRVLYSALDSFKRIRVSVPRRLNRFFARA